ncbi:hypothetical protein ACFL6C_09975 [Myxococcota bacterium]
MINLEKTGMEQPVEEISKATLQKDTQSEFTIAIQATVQKSYGEDGVSFEVKDVETGKRYYVPRYALNPAMIATLTKASEQYGTIQIRGNLGKGPTGDLNVLFPLVGEVSEYRGESEFTIAIQATVHKSYGEDGVSFEVKDVETGKRYYVPRYGLNPAMIATLTKASEHYGTVQIRGNLGKGPNGDLNVLFPLLGEVSEYRTPHS